MGYGSAGDICILYSLSHNLRGYSDPLIQHSGG